jgi:Cof subfamily protein (haloacid dehalogenase superfamily)
MQTESRRIRLLALDVDGTLLTSDHLISEATQTAIRSIAAMGVTVVLASARSPRALRPLMDQLAVSGYTVAYAGALLCHADPNPAVPLEIIEETHLPIKSAQRIFKDAVAEGVSVGWFIGETWHIAAWDEVVRHEAADIGMLPVLTPDLDTFTLAPHKLLCMVAHTAQCEQLQRLARQLPGDVTGQFSAQTLLEVIPLGIDKAIGLQRLGECLDIGLDEMAAIGDGDNDLKMLAEVGIGIAMGNGTEAMKQTAKWVTESNNKDGVALAIARLQAEGRL